MHGFKWYCPLGVLIMTFHGNRKTDQIQLKYWISFSIALVLCILFQHCIFVINIFYHYQYWHWWSNAGWCCLFCFSIAFFLSIFHIFINIEYFFVSVLALVVGCWHLGNLWTVCQLSKLRPSQIEKWKDITHIFKSEKWKDITYLFKKWKDNPSFQRWKDITHLFKSEKI